VDLVYLMALVYSVHLRIWESDYSRFTYFSSVKSRTRGASIELPHYRIKRIPNKPCPKDLISKAAPLVHQSNSQIARLTELTKTSQYPNTPTR
jgi:hypothetical protein